MGVTCCLPTGFLPGVCRSGNPLRRAPAFPVHHLAVRRSWISFGYRLETAVPSREPAQRGRFRCRPAPQNMQLELSRATKWQRLPRRPRQDTLLSAAAQLNCALGSAEDGHGSISFVLLSGCAAGVQEKETRAHTDSRLRCGSSHRAWLACRSETGSRKCRTRRSPMARGVCCCPTRDRLPGHRSQPRPRCRRSR